MDTTRPSRGFTVIVQVRAAYVIVSETLLMGVGERRDRNQQSPVFKMTEKLDIMYIVTPLS